MDEFLKDWHQTGKQITVMVNVFNTGMTGYKETLTDPLYSGQILTFTFPILELHSICWQTL